MSGLRIHHPTVRDAVLVVPHPGNPSIGMRPKDVLIHLDGEGNSIVSAGVWEQLQQARAGMPTLFMVLNEVQNPPTLRIESDGKVPLRRRVFRQHHDTVTDDELVAVAQQFAPRGVTPRIASA